MRELSFFIPLDSEIRERPVRNTTGRAHKKTTQDQHPAKRSPGGWGQTKGPCRSDLGNPLLSGWGRWRRTFAHPWAILPKFRNRHRARVIDEERNSRANIIAETSVEEDVARQFTESSEDYFPDAVRRMYGNDGRHLGDCWHW